MFMQSLRLASGIADSHTESCCQTVVDFGHKFRAELQEFFSGRTEGAKQSTGVRKDSQFTAHAVIAAGMEQNGNNAAEFETGMGPKSGKRSFCKHANSVLASDVVVANSRLGLHPIEQQCD